MAPDYSSAESKAKRKGTRAAAFALIGSLVSSHIYAADYAGSDGDSTTEVPQSRAWYIVPSITAGAIYTDNVDVSNANSKRSDFITEFSPSIDIVANTKRLKGHLGYQFSEYLYQNSSPHEHSQNTLNAAGNLEVVENWMYVDMSGSIGNQSISPFGASPGAGYLINSNSAETRTYQLSPYVKGRLWSGSNYELRYGVNRSDNNSSVVGGTNTDATTGRLSSGIGGTIFGWSVNYDKTDYHLGGSQDSSDSSVQAMLNILADPQFSFSVGMIHDSNNFAQSGSSSSNGGAFSFNWKPSPVSSLSGDWQRQNYGSTYMLAAGHRTPLSDMSYSFSQSVSSVPSTGAYGVLLYDLLDASLASQPQFSDPIVRAAEVNRRLALLNASPNAILLFGYLQTQITLQKSHRLSFVKRGVRNILTFTYQHSTNNSLLASSSFISGVSQLSSVTQNQFIISLAHELGTQSNLNASYDYLNSKGNGGTALSTKQQTVNLSYVKTLTKKTNASIGISHTAFKDESGSGYDQNAVSALITHIF